MILSKYLDGLAEAACEQLFASIRIGPNKLRKMSRKAAQLEEIKAAAQIIFEVSDKASFKATSIECPHGNIPSYPAHAWWCDECFFRLKNALEGKS